MLALQLNFVMLFSFMAGRVNAITVKTPQKQINVTSGSSVFLECTFSTSQPTNNLNIQWSFNPKSTMVPEQVYYYIAGNSVVQGNFEGRVTEPKSPSTTKNASITISKMQPSDSGLYSCEVHNFPDTEGKTEGNIMVNVLEKPSNAYCAIHGTVESGHLVSLTCHTERGNPTPTYTWTKLNQGKTKSVLGTTDFQSGTMYFKNLSQFEFGEYRCNASNIVGFSICTVELVEAELGGGAIAGAVIGSILAAALVVFLVWFVLHKLKKREYKTSGAAVAAEMQATPASGDSVRYTSIPTSEGGQQAAANSTAPPQEPSTQGGQAEGQRDVEA